MGVKVDLAAVFIMTFFVVSMGSRGQVASSV